MIQLAIQNEIELFCLPPHTTHKLQPLDVGAFGPLQKAWARQCDAYLARTGTGMQKQHIIREYMNAREKSFSANTILQAWKKSGLRPFNGVQVFTEYDFAPSKTTSNRAQVPETYPNELPSDFDPLQIYQPEEEEAVDQPSSEDDMDVEPGALANGIDHNRDKEPVGQEESSDEEDDGEEVDQDTVDAEDVDDEEMDVEDQETHPSDAGGVAHHMNSLIETPSDSAQAHSTPPTMSTNAESPTATVPAPQRQHGQNVSVQSKRLDRLLRPVSRHSSRDELLAQNIALQAELSLLRSQRNNAEAHAIFSRQELDLFKLQQSQKTSKRKAVRIDCEYLTGPEARERRQVQTAEREAKEKKKAETKKKQTAKTLSAAAKRAAIYNDPTHVFSGTLKSKNNDDLRDILTVLNLDTKGTKELLLKQILGYFEDHPEEKGSGRFVGLFNPSRRGRRAAIPAEETENVPPAIAAAPPIPHPLIPMLPREPHAPSQAIPGPSALRDPQVYSGHLYHPHPQYEYSPRPPLLPFSNVPYNYSTQTAYNPVPNRP